MSILFGAEYRFESKRKVSYEMKISILTGYSLPSG